MPKRIIQAISSKNARLRAVSLLDQVLFSAGNFILTVMFARSYSDLEVSAYGVGLSIALIVQSTQRSCYVVQNALLPSDIFRRRTSKVMGQHLIIWAIILLLEVLVAGVVLFFDPDHHYVSVLAAALVCTLIYAQLGFERIVLLKHDRVLDPFLISAGFFILCAGLFFIVPIFKISYLTTMALVGSFAVFKIVRLSWMMGRPDFFWGWRLAVRGTRRYFAGALFGVAGSAGFSDIPLFILTSLSAPIQSAAYVALRALIQPLNIVIRSLDVIDKNNSSMVGAGAHLRATFLLQMKLYAGISLMAILGAVFAGHLVVQLFYGDRYEPLWPILIGWSVFFFFNSITYPMETVIVKIGRLNAYNYWRLVAGVIGSGGALVLCPSYGAMGAIIASNIGWGVSVLSGLWLLSDFFLQQPKQG